MTAPHDTAGPVAGYRPPRTSDRHQRRLDEARFHEAMVELSWLWTGRPMSDRPRYGSMEYRSVDRVDGALHQYAANLAHCFPLPPAAG